jgi:hypothetical protein
MKKTRMNPPLSDDVTSILIFCKDLREPSLFLEKFGAEKMYESDKLIL